MRASRPFRKIPAMLEHSILVLHAWAHSPQADGARAWTRTVCDAAGRSLGFVRFAGAPSSSWFSWFRTLRLEVYDTDDASHLMSLTRSWGVLRAWRVFDADELDVGTIYTTAIVTSENQIVGYFDREQRQILDASGRKLARFVIQETGVTELSLAADLPANPFLRMLLLGSVLTVDATPGA